MNRLRELVVGYLPLGLCTGGLMWLVWLVSSILGPGNLDLNKQVIGTDHTAFHTAAILLINHRGEALFDYPALEEFRATQEAITGKEGFVDPYRNPPFYALPYKATSSLPYLISFAIWALIGLMALLGGLYLLRGRRIVRPLLWSLCFFPVFAVVSFGQNSLLSVGIFALTYHWIHSERRFLAGCSAGLLLFKPQLLMGLGLWWLLGVRRYWPSLLGLAVALAMLTALSIVFVPDESQAWIERLPIIAKYDSFEFFNLHNSRGFGALLTGNKTVGNWFGQAGMAIGVIWMVVFWRRHHRDPVLMFAAAVLVTLWASPHTLTYEWSIAIVPAILLWDHRPDLRETWLLLFAIAWVVLFVSTPLTKIQLSIVGVAIQVSVPVLGYVIWRVGQSLARKPTAVNSTSAVVAG